MFVNLHVHTQWSLLDGMCNIKKLVKQVKALGQTAVAITDHGNMAGVVEFYKECQKNDIKPIIGLETYIVPDRFENIKIKEQVEKNKEYKKQLLEDYKEKKKNLKGMTKEEKKQYEEEVLAEMKRLVDEDTSLIAVKDFYTHLARNDEKYFGNSVSRLVEIEDNEGNIQQIVDYKYGISHLVLLARTNEGYRNLINISSEAHLTGFYNKPRIDMEYLKEHGKGIIALSACRAGEIPRLILRGRLDLAKAKILEYCEIFDEFYLELQPGDDPEQKIVNEVLTELSKEMNIPLVVTCDAHYIKAEDADTHAVLLAVQTNGTINDENAFAFSDRCYYIHTEEELQELGFSQEAIQNTARIADKCDVSFTFGKFLLPKIKVPDGYTPDTYLAKLAWDGFYEYYNLNPKIEADKYIERLNFELEVISTKGLSDYLLIVWDYINWAKEHGILVGPGRGSAAGSLCCFFTKITTLDPMMYDLLFERFISIDRPTLPDIDVDFMEYINIPEDLELSNVFKSGRQQVIEYVISRYGAECICQIGTYGTLGTRSVLKDVARAMDIDYLEVNAVNKFIPSDAGKQWKLAECLYGNEEKGREPVFEVVEFAQKHPKLFEVALHIEGAPRHPSIHAAGVVIAPYNVRDLVPLMCGSEGEIASQFEMGTLEDLGIVKFDFLGLRTLGALDRTLDLIKERYGLEIDWNDIDINDPDSMKIIKDGHTDGLFQIESPGMKEMFRGMKRVTFDDIIAGLALYRPGPMDYIPQYIARANGRQEAEYMFPEMEPILKNTYGVIVYQEQVMRIARELGGFNAAQSDGFRKAVGKKNEEKIKEQLDWLVYGHHDDEKDTHIPGMVANGYDEEKCKQLALDIKKFASYAFNKAHAAAYAKVTVITAYIKSHYPLEFMAPLISSYIGKDDSKIVQYIMEAKRMGIKILPPDVNKSDFEFCIEGKAIRFGLGAIKGLSKAALLIVEERKNNGEFNCIGNFMDRLGKDTLNKKCIDALCLSGAIDQLALNSVESQFTIIEKISKQGSRAKIAVPVHYTIASEADIYEGNDINRINLLQLLYNIRGYGDVDQKVIDDYAPNVSQEELVKKYSKVLNDTEFIKQLRYSSLELNFLGLYLKYHPLFGKATPTNWGSYNSRQRFDVVTIIREVKPYKTKKGDPMAFITIETLEGIKEVVAFGDAYANNINKIDPGGVKVINLEANLRNGEYSYVMRNIKHYRNEAV